MFLLPCIFIRVGVWMHPRNYSQEGSFAFIIMLICTRNLMLRVTLIQAKSRNTHGDYSIQGKQRENQARRISWQITVSNGWVRKWQPAHKHCTNRVSPGKSVIPYFLPSSQFYTIPFVFPCIPAAGSCLPILSAGMVRSLWHACVLVCVHVCVCVLWPQESQIPLVGDEELVQVFWSDFVRLGQSV